MEKLRKPSLLDDDEWKEWEQYLNERLAYEIRQSNIDSDYSRGDTYCHHTSTGYFDEDTYLPGSICRSMHKLRC